MALVEAELRAGSSAPVPSWRSQSRVLACSTLAVGAQISSTSITCHQSPGWALLVLAYDVSERWALKLGANVQRILFGAAIAIATRWLGFSLLSLYSIPAHPSKFTEPTRGFLRAGLALDSGALSEMDVSPGAILWALDQGRSNPALLRTLEASLYSTGSRRNGDHNEVTFDAKNLKGCGKWPLTVYFSGSPAGARIEEVQTDCSPR